MGKIKDTILKELGGVEFLPKRDYEKFAAGVEKRLSQYFRPNIPSANLSRDRWMKKPDGVEVNIQGYKNKKYTLSGAELTFFCTLYSIYYDGYNGEKGKSKAAGAFVATIVKGEFSGINSEEKKELASEILNAAKRTAMNRDPERGTPKMLQGWITEKRWED